MALTHGKNPLTGTLLRSSTKLPMPPANGLKVLDPIWQDNAEERAKRRGCPINESKCQKLVERHLWLAGRHHSLSPLNWWLWLSRAQFQHRLSLDGNKWLVIGRLSGVSGSMGGNFWTWSVVKVVCTLSLRSCSRMVSRSSFFHVLFNLTGSVCVHHHHHHHHHHHAFGHFESSYSAFRLNRLHLWHFGKTSGMTISSPSSHMSHL
eukprot:4156392-Amphidinium_carterae.1